MYTIITVRYQRKNQSNETVSWKDLSDEAKSVIEWVVNPFTNSKEVVRIKAGEIFYVKYPKWTYKPMDDVNILITEKL